MIDSDNLLPLITREAKNETIREMYSTKNYIYNQMEKIRRENKILYEYINEQMRKIDGNEQEEKSVGLALIGLVRLIEISEKYKRSQIKTHGDR